MRLNIVIGALIVTSLVDSNVKAKAIPRHRPCSIFNVITGASLGEERECAKGGQCGAVNVTISAVSFDSLAAPSVVISYCPGVTKSDCPAEIVSVTTAFCVYLCSGTYRRFEKIIQIQNLNDVMSIECEFSNQMYSLVKVAGRIKC